MFFFCFFTLTFDLVLFLFGFLWRRRHGITAPDVIDLAELCEPDHEATEAPTTQRGAPGGRLPKWGGNLQRVRLKVTITFTPHPIPTPILQLRAKSLFYVLPVVLVNHLALLPPRTIQRDTSLSNAQEFMDSIR